MLMRVHQRNHPNPVFHTAISRMLLPGLAVRKGYSVVPRPPVVECQRSVGRDRGEAQSTGRFEAFVASLGYRSPGLPAPGKLRCVFAWRTNYIAAVVSSD